MNQQPFKTARMSSSSTKKSSKNSNCKSASLNKNNLENTLIKTNNPSLVIGNNSTLTQRYNSHSKCKGISTNPQSEITARLKTSNKKLPKAISQLKTDRKAEYTKLKAKQIQTEMVRKNSDAPKKMKKSKKKTILSINGNKLEENCTNQRILGNDLTKMSSFLSQGTHQITEMKKNSDSFVLNEIQKNQKHLIQKITLLEKQNCSLSQRNEFKLNQIRFSHDQEVNSLKEQMKNLNFKIKQQASQNITFEKESKYNENQFISLRGKLQQKDTRLISLQNHNKQLQQELFHSKDSISGGEALIGNLQKNISQLRQEKKSLQEQLSKCEKEKKYIKQNCVQVLTLLRQEFGEQLKLFSF